MAEWLSNLTAFRDAMLLFINLGILVLLGVVVGLLFFHNRHQARSLARIAEKAQEVPPENGLDGFKRARSNIDTNRLEVLIADWLERFGKQNEQLLTDVHQAKSPPADVAALCAMIEKSNESLRSLLSDWSEENRRRAESNKALQDVLREDIRSQTLRLKQLAEQSPAGISVTASGTETITTVAGDPLPTEIEREIRDEIRLIVDKLDMMSERMDEIFRI
ncbi:MAG: hypothetical protein ISQ14_09955 [Verrucomicrobiae bacterium]|jgi:hypothetical protein|nr:hypothetical protein [Verrucomicrobiae bacterium]